MALTLQDPLADKSEFQPSPNLGQFISILKDKSNLKVHLENRGFHTIRFGDATDIKVNLWYTYQGPQN